MKKNTSKTTSPAPATSAAKPAKKKAKSTGKATPAAVPLTPAPAASPVSPLAPAKPTASVPTIKSVPAAGAPAEPKAVAAAPVQTKIVARIDVGFGNALYVRGDGPGLSWSQGVPMRCVASDEWELALGESARPISFKVLINDATWCSGPDSVVASGSTVTITPDFA